MALQQRERAFVAIFVGLFAGFAVIFLLEMMIPWHPPQELNQEDRQQLGIWIAGLPLTAFLTLALIYFLGSAVGGYVTNKIAVPTRYRPALLTGFGLFTAGAANFWSIPHPLWFMVLASLLYFAGAWIGGRAAKH
jgi:hypothetical protein